MSHLIPSVHNLQSTERIDDSAQSYESRMLEVRALLLLFVDIRSLSKIRAHMQSIPHNAIYVLDDDSLLNIFRLYRQLF